MDIVERLRKGDPCGNCKRDDCRCVIMEDAADEIERLRGEVKAKKLALNHAGDCAFEMLRQDAEIERLREALRAINRKNDNPAWFNPDLHEILEAALQQKDSGQ
jgi:uncharacterized membrane protein YccC